MPDDGIVYAFKATVKSMTDFFPAKDEQSQSFQALTLFSGGKEIKCILKNREAFPKEWKGKSIYMLAHQSDKGWHGVKSKDNDYKGKIERVLWVTKAAEITLAADYEAGTAPEPRMQGGTTQDSQNAPRTQPARNGGQRGESIPPYEQEAALKEVRKMLWRSHHLMRLCLRMAEIDRQRYREDSGRDMSDPQFQAVVSTHYISCRDALGMLPGKPIEFPKTGYQAAAPEPVSEVPREAKPAKVEPEPAVEEEVPF